MAQSGASIFGRIASFALFLAAWELTAGLAGSRLLPTASAVLVALANDTVEGTLVYHMAVTLARVSAAFVVAMVIGTTIGLAMGRLRRVDTLFDSWLILLLNLPALVVIALSYVWFGLNEAAAIGAVAVNKIPMVAVTLREGARALDRDYLEVAYSFRLGLLQRLRHVVLPQLYPYLIAAARSGLALIWKIVLVVELLGRSNGVGFQIQLYFQLFDVTQIWAYTIAFTAVIQIIEWGVLQPIEHRASQWRR